jgi:hypothetical protein
LYKPTVTDVVLYKPINKVFITVNKLNIKWYNKIFLSLLLTLSGLVYIFTRDDDDVYSRDDIIELHNVTSHTTKESYKNI